MTQQVFDRLQVRDIISWNALLAGFSECGRGQAAMHGFEQMLSEGILPNTVTCLTVLKACGRSRIIEKGKSIHAMVTNDKLAGCHLFVGTALVDMYAKCGVPTNAQEAFDQLPYHDLVSWNAVINGHSYGDGKHAFTCLEQMQSECFFPNSVTFLCMLRACNAAEAFSEGKMLHARIVGQGLMHKHVELGAALVDMYVKFGKIRKAEEVFVELEARNVVCWTALIAGYAQCGWGEVALNCFEQMQHEGVSPNAVTYVCILKASGSIGAVNIGKTIHSELFRKGLLGRNMFVGNALVDLYAKCNALSKAQEVFRELQVRDVTSWNIMITAFTQHGCLEEAMDYIVQMQREGLSPDACTFACILKVCGSMGAISTGKEVHGMILCAGLEKDGSVGNALVDMYAKCGALAMAQDVFERLANKNVVSWTELISGYAQLGKDDVAVELFNKMIWEGIKPNVRTFTVILNACSHSGLLDEGGMYFDAMNTGYGVIPTQEHHACMVDLFGRAGQFDDAVALVRGMPAFDYLPIWTTLLGACQKWGNPSLGRRAFEHAVRLDETHDAAYICMGNIYAAADHMNVYTDRRSDAVES